MRFKEFEGEWVKKKLGEVTKVSSGGTPSRTVPLYWNGNIPWVSTTLINFNTISDTEEKITEEGLKNSAAKLFPKGSLLMALYGQGKTRGKVAMLGINATTNQACASLIVDDKILNSFFLFQNLSSRYKEIRDLSNQGGQENLSGSIIKEIGIIFPSLHEQQKIAHFLTLLDERVSTQSKIIEQLETLIKGLREKLFIQQLRFNDDEGNSFPDWEKHNLSTLAKIMYGKDQKQIADENGRYPILGTGGIIGKTNSFLYNKASVLIGRKGTIDNPVYIDTPFWTVDTLFYTDVFANTLPRWLYYKFQTINWYLYNEASGVPSLSASTIYKIKIELPCLKEQTKIINFLCAIDKKIHSEKLFLQQLERQKRYLLKNLFI